MAPGGSSEALPTVALIGATGSGKSSTGNTLFGLRGESAPFKVEELSLASVTSETRVEVREWRGGNAQHDRTRIVDSPGLGDSEGRDALHIAGLATKLKDEVEYVHAFLVVFNSQEPRLNIHLREMLVVFRNMFGEGFLRHLMVVFTRFEFDRRAKKRRQRSGNTPEQLAAAMNEELRKALGHSFDCPCVFLDNSLCAAEPEDLEDLYDEPELEEIWAEHRAQVDKVFEFMMQSEPFHCKDVKAVATQAERLKKKIMQLIQLVNEEALGRKLISAEQGVMHRGWVRWRRRWLWGVLRRQHLRFFEDESGEKLTGPREVDLTGCICSSGSEWESMRRFPTFTVYRPVNRQSADGSYFCHILQTRTEQERQRWVLFVQEATQVCESCHRIEKFHSTVESAPNREEYERAIALVEQETMVIPVEWVLQQVRTPNRIPSLQQALKDLARDSVEVDGVRFSCPEGEDLAAHICARVLQGSEDADDDKAEVKAAVIARDVLLGSSRTQGGGDTLEAVNWFFRNEQELVFLRAVPMNEPILVRVLRRSGGGGEGDALRSMGPDTGVPAFQRDESASRLSAELWRKMDQNTVQTISACRVDTDAWVPDWQMVQCMRCGERFNPLLRRHHCRACGALVCYSCSRHWVAVAQPGCDDGEVVQQRVCFLCYQRAVIKDLDARKERGLKPVVNEEDFLCESTSQVDVCAELEADCERASDSTNGEIEVLQEEVEEVQGDPWPAVSIEMKSRFKVTCTESMDEWFVLECKYVKLVRWTGLADEGRIFISVIRSSPDTAGKP